MPTSPMTSNDFHAHAHSPNVDTLRHNSQSGRKDRRLQSLLNHSVGVCVSRQHLQQQHSNLKIVIVSSIV
jgi:hypothetical protein